MTDRDRLIELISHKQCYGSPVENGVKSVSNETLADYLIANGVIVPPCKVGDKVYYVFEGEIRELKVISLSYMFLESFKHFNLHTTNSRGAVLSYEIKDIGKTVFLTRKEAEKALGRSKGNETNI